MVLHHAGAQALAREDNSRFPPNPILVHHISSSSWRARMKNWNSNCRETGIELELARQRDEELRGTRSVYGVGVGALARTSSWTKFNSRFPPIRSPCQPTSSSRNTLRVPLQFEFIMLAHQHQLAVPIRVLHAGAPARDTLRVSLQIQLILMLLAHRLELEIQFPIPSSSSSSWQRTSSCTRYVSRFPPIRIPSNSRSLQFQFQFLMLASTHHLQLDIQFAFSLQFEFFIMPAYQQLQNEIQFAFLCNSSSYSSNSYRRTSFCTRYNSRSSAIQILFHHTAYQFRSVAFLPNSKSSSSSCNSVHKIQFASPPIPIRLHRARYNWQSQV